jgi:hypothetical protein
MEIEAWSNSDNKEAAKTIMTISLNYSEIEK